MPAPGSIFPNGCGAPGSHPLEDATLALLEKNKLNSKDAPIYIQSFDPESLKYLRKAGMKAKGVQLIDKSPRKGAEGLDIAFLHPKSTGGILLELCEDPKKK